MRINCSKTKLMLFNKSRTADIQPELYVNETQIDMVEETKSCADQ